LTFNNANIDSYRFEDFFHVFMDNQLLTTRESLELWLLKATSKSESGVIENETGTLKPATDRIRLETIAGEVIISTIENTRWTILLGKINSNVMFTGFVCLTNYRLAFVSSKFHLRTTDSYSFYSHPHFFDMLTVPLSTITRIQYSVGVILVITKDNRFMRIYLSPSEIINTSKLENFANQVQQTAFTRVNNVMCSHVFAYKYRAMFATNGWIFADVRREYSRQDLTGNAWQVCSNKSAGIVFSLFSFCRCS
jgi:hypothetical protein